MKSRYTKNLVISLLLGLAATGFTQAGIDVTGDPVRVGGDLHENTTLGDGQNGGQITIPDNDPLRQQPPAHDVEAHKLLKEDINKVSGDVAALKADFEAYKAAEKDRDRYAFAGNHQAYRGATTRSANARTRLRKKGVAAKVFDDKALFKALDAALKSGKLDTILKSRLNTWMADENTTLGRMFAAAQKVAGIETTLYGDKDNPTDDMAYRLENLEKWAATDQTLPFEPSKNYAAVDSGQTPDPAAPAAGTTPSAPADEGAVTVPSKGTEQGAKPPPPAEKGKEEAKPSSNLLDKARTPQGVGTMAFLALTLGCLALPGVRRRIASAR